MHANENEGFLIAYMSASKKQTLLFFSPLALLDVNECERNPCKNGGICIKLC